MKGYIKEIHPVLPVKNVFESLLYYTDKLGFNVAFADEEKNPTYAGIIKDGIEIHLQWHDASEWEAGIDRPMLRFVVQNIEALYEEYKLKGVFHNHTSLSEKPWGTKEFAFYDPDMNGLTFYCDL